MQTQGEGSPEAGRPRWREHWPLAAALAVAAVLLFARLGGDYLWADEGDTAVLARNILSFGVPAAWDGVTFTDSDFGARVNSDLVMVSHPWLQYYLAAASFRLLGESALAARLPFALLGLATILLVYVIAWRAARDRWTAFSAALLVTLSVQFLLYGRESRHYAPNEALTCLLVLQFSRLNSWKHAIGFAVVAILLFHSHPIAVAPLLALGVLTLVYRPCAEQRRWLWRAMPVIGVFTIPWLLVARTGYGQNMIAPQGIGDWLARLGQFAVEMASVTPVVGAAMLAIVAWRRRGRQPAGKGRAAGTGPRVPLFSQPERTLVAALLSIIAAYAVLMALTQGPDEIFAIGLRYTPAVIPFVAVITALLVAKVSGARRYPWAALLIVLAFTRAGQLTPWTFWDVPAARRNPAQVVTGHRPARAIDRVLATDQGAFLQGLVRENPGTTGRIVEFLKAHASPTDVVLTNYGWEPLYFHTRLPQGMTVLSTYPIYEAAKAHGLPDYVFRPEGARWIVWRAAWGPYRGQDLDRVIAQLQEAQVPVGLVARIPETLWENRENVHFRRYPGNRYIFPWYGDLPDALIYRVDWPKAAAGPTGAAGSAGPQASGSGGPAGS